jgi:hypothetical protein
MRTVKEKAPEERSRRPSSTLVEQLPVTVGSATGMTEPLTRARW